MPQSYNNNISELAVAKQTAEGTVNTTPTYSLQVFSGRPHPRNAFSEINVTDMSNSLPMVWKGVEDVDLTTQVPAFPGSVGVFLKGALPTDTYTPGTPSSHIFTPGGTDVFNTFFSTMPASLFETFVDVAVGGLVFEFGDDKLLKLNVTGVGKAPTRSATTYTAATTAEIIAPTAKFFHTNGATFKFTVNGTPATDVLNNVQSGSLTIARPVTPVPTADTIASVFFNKERLNVSADMNLIVKDWTAYNTAFYGSPTGTTASSTVPSASLDFTFPCYNDATFSLRVQMPSLQLQVDPPDPSPDGGPLLVHVTASGVRPTSGSLVTVTLLNSTASAY